MSSQPPPYSPPHPAPPHPGPYGPPPRPPRRRRRVGRIVAATIGAIVGVLVVGGITSSIAGGRIVRPTPMPTVSTTTAAEPVTLAAFDLKPGDCYTDDAPMPTDGTTRTVTSVESVPCAQPHTAQVVAVPDYAGQTWGKAMEASTADCTREFQAKVRAAVLKNKRYRLGRIYPDVVAWGRTSAIACIVVTEASTTGSVLKG